jgi:hypothetical protein
MLSARGIPVGIRRFLSDERGAVVVDQLPVLFLLIVIVMLIFEIGLAYFMTLGTAKAAQLGARVAVTLAPAHPGVPESNQPNTGHARAGDTCFQPTGADACVDPGGPWTCDGTSLGACDLATFARITAEMRRVYPRLIDDDVVITYRYRRLGTVEGPFVPEVNVAVRSQNFPFFTLILSDVTGWMTEKDPIAFAGTSASAFGESMGSG